MKYLLMICGSGPPTEEQLSVGCGGWSEEMARRGVLRGGAGLRPPEEAATVRVRDGEVLVADGPFAETKEQVAGFSLIECADMAEALDIAAKHPVAGYGSIEVRPVWDG